MARHTPHLLVPAPWTGATLELSSDQRHHLGRVLRRVDGPVTYTDGAGTLGSGELAAAGVIRGDESTVGRPSTVHMAVAPTTSADRNRTIVEKLQELGVARLSWLRTDHTQGRVPSDSKLEAWAIGALEQSRGAWLMAIDGPIDLDDLPNRQLLAGGGEGRLQASSVLCIGPEGGWSDAELGDFSKAVGLPFPVLRTDTAAVTAAAVAITSTSRRQ